ncbi:hypothetical protein [Zobellia uliginosa]|uniref:hypothetical protein n=1 Tax=Zobellia uliginosa TaxID=143224 RepID=UPI0026E243BC|nr:hypothetical protein [Zobellia uliginosa]MDO6518526.1 hypothetical protein [Zobellia uliginosa]
MFNLFKKTKNIESKIPRRIPIMRMEEYHTHYLGKAADGKLFFGSVTFAYKKPIRELAPEEREKNRIELAILYLFDKNGKFSDYKYWSTEKETERQSVWEKMSELVSELGQVTYGNIEVETFEIDINGIKCGLIPNEESVSIDLYPSNTISFQEPWDGEYYT